MAPELISVDLRAAMDSLLYRWRHTSDWTARQFGMAVHAEAVRIHPFVDGNGRVTRLLADLVFVAAQDGNNVEVYDWDVDKVEYIALLRLFDRERDARTLAALVRTRPLSS